MNKEKFMPIPPGAIIPGSMPQFEIYVLSTQGNFVLWALKGKEVTPEQLGKLTESGPREVFISLAEEFKYEQYLEGHLGKILENHALSDDQKGEIFSRVSTNVLKEAFENAFGLGIMSEDAFERTQVMVRNALCYVAESGSLQALAKMIGHDYQTYTHATKVLWLTVAFLRENVHILETIEPSYKSADEDRKMEILKQCGVAALLHDIGKASIAPEILNKVDPLSSGEWEDIKRHPVNGVSMLLDTDVPSFVKRAVLHHHEDFHGGGYPMGLEGSNISILARVLRIIDVFDAMTSRRPYKAPISPGKAVKIMVGTPPDTKKEESGPDRKNQDLGMRRCFDEGLLRKFILFLGNARLTD
ncbi:MAG TPA: HD domain-containing phosphohydrolase [Syntrophorhabdaceae bacterium]